MKTGIVAALAVTAPTILAGCTPALSIHDLEQDKVIVWETTGGDPDRADVDAMAQEGCAIHGRTATPIRVTHAEGFEGYHLEYLYACVEPLQ